MHFTAQHGPGLSSGTANSLLIAGPQIPSTSTTGQGTARTDVGSPVESCLLEAASAAQGVCTPHTILAYTTAFEEVQAFRGAVGLYRA